MKLLTLLLAITGSLTTAFGQGKPDTIRVGDPLQKFSLLKPTVRQYIRYMAVNGRRVPFDIWTRKVSFEEFNGKQAVRIYQQWEGADTTKNKILDSWFEWGTFKPLAHDRISGKILESYKFQGLQITGTDKPGNTKKDFAITGLVAPYNFETDMESFQLLPLKRGYVAVMPFYHAGGGKPEWYTFKVEGEEMVKLANGKKMQCWIITTDYNSPQSGITRYWLEKGTQLFVKQQTPIRNGFLYKMLFAMPE